MKRDYRRCSAPMTIIIIARSGLSAPMRGRALQSIRKCRLSSMPVLLKRREIAILTIKLERGTMGDEQLNLLILSSSLIARRSRVVEDKRCQS